MSSWETHTIGHPSKAAVEEDWVREYLNKQDTVPMGPYAVHLIVHKEVQLSLNGQLVKFLRT